MAKQQSLQDVHVCSCRACQQHPHAAAAREHRRINRLLASADERLRRRLAGFLAQQHGRGRVSRLARVTGLDRNTIRRGQRELHCGPPRPAPRVRHPGAGRPRAEKKAPAS